MPNIIRIRDLAHETDASNAYIPVDKSSYGISAKKISISDIANYLGVLCGVTFDIMTGELVIETNYGYYITDLDGRYAIIMDDLADVNATYPSENDVLVYKSSFWTTTSNFISGLTFDIGTGILTLMTQIGDFAYDLDGRYASELNELIDVNAPAPSDNDVLIYSGGIWINSAATFSVGIITGGTSGEVLIKNSSTDYDISWSSHNSIAGLNVGNYIHHSSSEISDHPYLSDSNIFNAEINTFQKIKLSQVTPDKWLKIDSSGITLGADLPDLTTTFLTLDDVIPETYIGYDANVPIVNESLSALTFIDTEEIETVTAEFVLLADVPDNYSGQSYKYVVVSPFEDALIFTTGNDPKLNDGWHYFGPDDVDGTWRQGVSGSTFVTQIRSGGTWETKQTINS